MSDSSLRPGYHAGLLMLWEDKLPYIKSVSEEAATGKLQELYAADRQALGYVPHYTEAMSLHPEVAAAWRQLSAAIRSTMRLRRYELVTYAAALALKCTY
jgi:hypothetical protein